MTFIMSLNKFVSRVSVRSVICITLNKERETMLRGIVLILLITLDFANARNSINYTIRAAEERETLNRILSNYDNRIRPFSNDSKDGVTYVNAHLYISYLSNFDADAMTFDMDTKLYLRWIDERLKYENNNNSLKYITLIDPKQIWVPNINYVNEVNSHHHNIMQPNTYAKIFPNGKVLYSLRVYVTMRCPMNLKYYPFDQQACNINLTSYSYDDSELILAWYYHEPLWLRNFPTAHKFSIQHSVLKSYRKNSYSYLSMSFLYKRPLGHYLKNCYMPLTLLVLVSWLSFWFSERETFARTVLGIGPLFPAIFKVFEINRSSPHTPDFTALEIWTHACLTFIFAVSIQFVVVDLFATKKEVHQINLIETDFAENSDEEKAERKNFFRRFNLKSCKFFKSSERFDIICRIIFPLLFVLFNIVYWSVYLNINH